MKAFRKHLLASAIAAGFSGPVVAADTFVALLGVTVSGPRAAQARAAGHPGIEKLLAQPTDVWERVRDGFAMPEVQHELVAQHEAWYAARPALVSAILTRARRYLHFIAEEVERRGLPSELALLPVVESGFNPMALSSAQASGLWQFIPATATRYRLPQTDAYDARRDIVASTGAALEYLQFLHHLHRDWHLALASYNWGEEAVGRAAQQSRARGGKGTFGELSLPDETRHYVTRLQAVKNIIADPKRFGIELAELANEPYFTVIPVKDVLPVATAARLAGMPVDEFLALNPAWNSPRIAGSVAPGLVLPVDRVKEFESNLATWRKSAEGRRERTAARQRGA